MKLAKYQVPTNGRGGRFDRLYPPAPHGCGLATTWSFMAKRRNGKDSQIAQERVTFKDENASQP